MIKLTRLNNDPIIINADLIQSIEETPDTVITLTRGIKYVVREKPAEVVEKVIFFRRSIINSIELMENRD